MVTTAMTVMSFLVENLYYLHFKQITIVQKFHPKSTVFHPKSTVYSFSNRAISNYFDIVRLQLADENRLVFYRQIKLGLHALH